MTKRSLTRRVFLIGSAAIGGTAVAGLGIGVGYLAMVDVDGHGARVLGDGSVDLTAWINISPDNTITIYVPFLEMGQGTHTGLAQLVGEELGLDINADNIRVVHPSEDLAAFANWTMILDERPERLSGPLQWLGKRVVGALGVVATGGSTAMVASFTAMREAGAIAREMLTEAAAAELGVHRDRLMLGYAGFGTADGKEVKFGEIAARAAKLAPPATVTLKDPAKWELIGKPVPRVDVPAKVAGTAVFGTDVRPEGLLFAALRRAPQFGAKVASLSEGDVRKRRGIVEIVRMDDAVAVVADNSWRAREAVDALEITWGAPAVLSDSAALVADLKARLKAKAFTREEKEGDFDRALGGSMQMINEVYETPFLAHAAMEPMNATVLWRADDTVEVRVPTQSSMLTRSAVEGVGPAKRVDVHVTLAGGGFGRRAETDFVSYAARVALAVKGRPVQTLWSREEDTRGGAYRPASVAMMTAALDGRGQLEGLSAIIAAPSLSSSFMARNVGLSSDPASDRVTLEGIVGFPYLAKARRIAAVDTESPAPIGYWRSVGHSHNGFYMEAFIDECAAAAGIDPAEFRRMHLAEGSRHARVLEKLVAASGWSGRGGNGRGRGLALHESFRSVVGAVVDVSVSGTTVKLEKVTIAADCGRIINPQLVEAQMQGGFVFGLTAAIYGKIDIVAGAAQQGNFDSYRMLRLAEAPPIEVHLLDSEDLPGGVGEPGTPVAAPALVAAIFSATGERLRKLPIAEAGYTIG